MPTHPLVHLHWHTMVIGAFHVDAPLLHVFPRYSSISQKSNLMIGANQGIFNRCMSDQCVSKSSQTILFTQFIQHLLVLSNPFFNWTWKQLLWRWLLLCPFSCQTCHKQLIVPSHYLVCEIIPVKVASNHPLVCGFFTHHLPPLASGFSLCHTLMWLLNGMCDAFSIVTFCVHGFFMAHTVA